MQRKGDRSIFYTVRPGGYTRDMSTRKMDPGPTTFPRAAAPWDATVREIDFVVRRAASRDWAIEVVNRRCHILAFATAGRAEYQCGGERFEVRRGQMLFFPKGMAHSGRSDPQTPWSFFSTAFDLEFFDPAAAAALADLPQSTTPANTVEVQALYTELERRWVARETGYMLRCRSAVLQLLFAYIHAAQPAASAAGHARRLASIVTLLQANPMRTFSIEELSARARLSPSRFRVLFKRHTGHSVVRYQNWLRLNRAKDLLLTGEYTVTEAAKETGFLDVYYFSRLFKKLTGSNPSYYRNQ